LDHKLFIQFLRDAKSAVSASIVGLSQEASEWRPGQDSWSVLEVVNHLWDEEILDFRPRLKSIIEGDNADWDGINPRGWVTEKRYNERDLAESMAGFQAERQASLDWLNSLVNPNMDAEKTHPEYDPISAGNLLASWVAHDLLHLIQINRCKLAYFEELAKPHSISYARG